MKKTSLSGFRRRVYHACFSVRGLMIAVLVLGGIVGPAIVRARAQRAAVRAVQAVGGRVAYDWQCVELPDGTWEETESKLGPFGRWAIRTFGPDAFNRVVKVDLAGHGYGVHVGAGELDSILAKYVARLHWLRSIDISENDCTANSLRHFQNLKRVTHIGIQSGELLQGHVKASGLAYLRDLTELVDLDLSGMEFEVDDLSPLTDFGNIRRLHLRGISVTDAGMKVVAKLPELRSLVLSEVLVTNEGLALLADSKIEELDVDLCRFKPFTLFVLDRLFRMTFKDYRKLLRANSLAALRYLVREWWDEMCYFQAYGYVFDSGINDDTFDRIADIRTLRKLRLDDQLFNESRIRQLLASKNIEEICLDPGLTLPGDNLPIPSWSNALPPSVRLTYQSRSIHMVCGNAWPGTLRLLVQKYLDHRTQRLVGTSNAVQMDGVNDLR